MTEQPHVHRTRSLVVTPPPGWAVARVELVSLDVGAWLAIAADAVEGAATTTAEQRGRTLASELPAYREEALEEVSVAGRRLAARRFSWEGQGAKRHEQFEFYRPGRLDGCVATLSTPGLPPAPWVTGVADLVARVSLDARALPSRTFSVEELACLAEVFGAPTFPGTGDYALTDDAGRASTRRALLARGTLRVDVDGGLLVEDVAARLLVQALRPAATVTVERRHPAGIDRTLVLLGEALSVVHTASLAGLHRFEGIPTPYLAEPLVASLGIESRPPADNGPMKELTVTADAFAQARDGGADGRGRPVHQDPQSAELTAIVESVRTSGHVRLHPTGTGGDAGRDLIWLDAGERGLWRILPRENKVTLAPVNDDELTRELAALVVGGTDQATAAASSRTGDESDLNTGPTPGR